jgi:hypothetical protein
VAPNARWPCLNLVLFTDRLGPEDLDVVRHRRGIAGWAREATTLTVGQNRSTRHTRYYDPLPTHPEGAVRDWRSAYKLY